MTEDRTDARDMHAADAPEHHQPYRIMLRPFANPLPISLLGLLIVTSSVAALQLGWVPSGQSQVVGRGVVVVALALQLPGAFFGVLARDPAAGTGMAVLGTTWLIVGLSLATTPPGSKAEGLGVFLIVAAVALMVPLAASLAKPVTVIVIATSAVRFSVTGMANITGSPGWETAAGALGLVLGLVALYAAMAFELEDVHHRAILPLGRRGPAALAMSRDTREQLRGIESEAGVRQQL